MAVRTRLTENQLQVLSVVSHRALPTGSVAAVAGLSRAKAVSALRALETRRLVVLDDGHWKRAEA